MSKTVVVRYRTRPEAADENARLIEEVRELAQRCAEQPAPSEATLVGSYAW